MSARVVYGACAECAWGKVAGCWRCGSRVTDEPEDVNGFLRRISGGQPVEAVSDVRVNSEPRPDLEAELAQAARLYGSAANSLPRVPMPAEACTELGADARPPRLSLWRWLQVFVLEHELTALIDERARYERLGFVGPVYELNSLRQQRQLMSRIRVLKGQPPLSLAEEVQA